MCQFIKHVSFQLPDESVALKSKSESKTELCFCFCKVLPQTQVFKQLWQLPLCVRKSLSFFIIISAALKIKTDWCGRLSVINETDHWYLELRFRNKSNPAKKMYFSVVAETVGFKYLLMFKCSCSCYTSVLTASCSAQACLASNLLAES